MVVACLSSLYSKGVKVGQIGPYAFSSFEFSADLLRVLLDLNERVQTT